MTFPAPFTNKADQEEGDVLAPKFDADGLVTAIAVDAADGAILMLAYMNAEALELTVSTGIAHYWSRSRQSLWKKGETSGNLQDVSEILVDCDQDAILLRVTVRGHDATCHTGRRSCFFRKVVKNADGKTTLEKNSMKLFDPKSVYP